MLPRYRNLGYALADANKLIGSSKIATDLLYVRDKESIEDPSNLFDSFKYKQLRLDILEFLQDYGFPSLPLAKKNVANIDAGIAKILYEHFLNVNYFPKNSEAADLRVWSFFNIRLIPDIIIWRFGGQKVFNVDRLIGVRRNYTGYLWMTAWLFCNDQNKDKWNLLNVMQVDTIVQIVERPGNSYSKIFIKELIEELILMTEANPSLSKSELIRGVTKRATFTRAVIRPTSNLEINRALAIHLLNWSKKYYLGKAKFMQDNEAETESSNLDSLKEVVFIKKLKKQDLSGEIFIPKKYLIPSKKGFFPNPILVDPKPIGKESHCTVVNINGRDFDIYTFRQEFHQNSDTRFKSQISQLFVGQDRNLSTIIKFIRIEDKKYSFQIINSDHQDYKKTNGLLESDDYYTNVED